MKKLLIDVDFIIKITKAGLKAIILDCFDAYMLEKVRQEVVEEGLEKGCEDAMVVKNKLIG